MSAIRILIIEDNELEAEKLQRCLEEQQYEVMGIAINLKDALGLFYSQKPDLVIIDIFLDGKPHGITFAERMNENHHTKKPFIFLTSATDRTTFETARMTAPFSYLLKPFNVPELQYAVELAIEKFANEIGTFSSGQHTSVIINETFFIKKDDFLIKVPIKTIQHISVEGRYLNIYSNSGNFMVQLPLVEILHKLPEKQFLRINRNTVVNVSKIISVNLADNQIILEDNECILMSKRGRDHIVKLLDVLR